jgi:hypothetical protein
MHSDYPSASGDARGASITAYMVVVTADASPSDTTATATSDRFRATDRSATRKSVGKRPQYVTFVE